MVSVFLREGDSHGKVGNHALQQSNVQPTLHCQLAIFLNFQKVLKDAVAAHGIPSKLYVDNGCSYMGAQLSLICGSIGTVLLHTQVRDGASKAYVKTFVM